MVTCWVLEKAALIRFFVNGMARMGLTVCMQVSDHGEAQVSDCQNDSEHILLSRSATPAAVSRPEEGASIRCSMCGALGIGLVVDLLRCSVIQYGSMHGDNKAAIEALLKASCIVHVHMECIGHRALECATDV